MQRVGDIAPTLTSPLLSGLVSNIHLLGRPLVPREPVSSKAEEGLWGRNRTPARLDVPGPSRNGRLVPHMGMAKVEAEESKPCEQGGIDLDQTWLLLSYQMMMKLTSPLICTRLPLCPKLNQPGTRSDPWRTGVHAHLLQRSGQQKKRRGARLPVKQFYPEGYMPQAILFTDDLLTQFMSDYHDKLNETQN